MLRARAAADRTFVAINCGANMNFDRLRYVAERADLGAQRETLLAVEMPEAAGSFLRFSELLGQHSVTEFNYRYGDGPAAQVFRGSCPHPGQGRSEIRIIKTIGDAGFAVRDMTDNEMAKLHVRYMVGGQARGLTDERLVSLRISGTSRRTCSGFYGRSALQVGTSVYSITAITVRITAACSRVFKCLQAPTRTSRCI